MFVQQDHYKKSYYETPFHSRTSELNILNEWQRWKDYTVATNYFRTEMENVGFDLEGLQVKQGEIVVPAQGLAEGTLFIEINNAALSGDKNRAVIEVYSGEDLIETTSVTFLGPRSYN